MYNTKGYQNLNIENILKKITEYDIFKYYIKGFEKPGRKFCSEIRVDKNPSCSIKVMTSGKAFYRDWATGETYDCFKYIQRKYSLTYYESLKVISNDFNLKLHSGNVEITKTQGMVGMHFKKQPTYSDTRIRIVSIPFTPIGKTYWDSYGITEEVLTRYNVKQISHYYINTSLITIPRKEIAFSYAFGNYKYKILRPSGDQWKWISNANSLIIQGMAQLSDYGDTLFITKSLKDVMVLSSLEFDAIAPQSENTVIPLEIITHLKGCWSRIIIYYDNDGPGITAAQSHCKLYKVGYIHNALEGPKDPSDYFVRYGREDLKQMIIKLIEKHG